MFLGNVWQIGTNILEEYAAYRSCLALKTEALCSYKSGCSCTRLYGVAFKNTSFFVVIAMRASDLTLNIYLLLQINEMKDCELELPVVRADKRYFSLNHRGDSKDTWGLVSDVTVQDGGTIITLRSIIQVSCPFSKIGCVCIM
jgi:hypothetical protein